MSSFVAPELPEQFESLLPSSTDLIAAIAQDASTGEVLMLAWMNRASIAQTLSTGKATYWSRSRNELWVKGETSGHTQFVKSMALDCDGDALLIKVDQVGPACHTGELSCFHVKVS
jgi:phosphoribosyl-AMP cyclohydrolase